MTVSVLLVDDSDILRDLMNFIVDCDTRFTIIGEAANGREAIETAARFQPDVIILDQYMDELRGSQALPQLRALVPHAFIAGYSGDSTGELSAHLESELDIYIPKGASVRMLFDSIADALERRQVSDPGSGSAGPHSQRQ
ncbi:MAG: hypothetical protein QOG53_3145 [Frankiales bacterium]|nr:hypothetical protein [Frankiales bacterium]